MAKPLYKIEREKVAQMRFVRFIIDGTKPNAYPFGVMDSLADPKTIAKFRTPTDADLFIAARQTRYVETGM